MNRYLHLHFQQLHHQLHLRYMYHAQLESQSTLKPLYDLIITTYNPETNSLTRDLSQVTDYIQNAIAANEVTGRELLGDFDKTFKALGLKDGSDYSSFGGKFAALGDNYKFVLDSSNKTIIYGTTGNDYLDGSANGEAYLTSDGDDTIYSRQGDDMIYAGSGNDYIDSCEGDDVVYGEDGFDTIYTKLGNDMVYAGTGNDYVDSGDGNDLVYGDDGNDNLNGGLGTDTMFGGVGHDLIDSGDGGFSGGTMDRPAFKELLSDIEKDEIDIVVVYKVDRLTRSLMDFSKIIEVFDNHNASFVSITQHFNTTTSIGRLTLNILLSFAQFEREVTGERIRDKFAASRQKGLWLTGAPPYGYKKDKHNILVKEEQCSQNLKTIFEIYLKLGTVNKLRDYLIENEIISKNCKPFSSGNLYKMLSNKVYLGKIVHKDKVFDGQHEAIISEKLFERVQELLKSNAVIRKHATNAKEGSLLCGLLFDDKGNRMIPSHSNKSGKRYRYYISQTMKTPGELERGDVTKISAGEIENYAKNEVLKVIKNKQLTQKHLADFAIEQQNDILQKLSAFEPDKIFIRTIIKQVDLRYMYHRQYHLSLYQSRDHRI